MIEDFLKNFSDYKDVAKVKNKSGLSNVGYSVVIPTLLKDEDVLSKLLSILLLDDGVYEILLINNSKKQFNFTPKFLDTVSVQEKETFIKKIHERNNVLRIINMPENIYVNPAWNLGVKLASSRYVAILNDDMFVPFNYVSAVYAKVKEHENRGRFDRSVKPLGIIGVNIKNICNTDVQNFTYYPTMSSLAFEPLQNIISLYHYAIALFVTKENYFEIPYDLKVFCGDNYILMKAKEAGYENIAVDGANFLHLRSLSSRYFSELDIEDNYVYATKYHKDYYNYIHSVHYRTPFQRIFSIKRVGWHDNRKRILTCLGLRFNLDK